LRTMHSSETEKRETEKRETEGRESEGRETEKRENEGREIGGIGLSYRIYEKGLRRVLETCSSFELPEKFVEYLRIRPEPPVNNTVVFLKKEVC